mmetsp:Transcript_25038/g.41975  ORF Transcript_25038/g.41975 Transcript_25038/m.41975 type:complete len:130 (+) Transcript_25038:19-408(+)
MRPARASGNAALITVDVRSTSEGFFRINAVQFFTGTVHSWDLIPVETVRRIAERDMSDVHMILHDILAALYGNRPQIASNSSAIDGSGAFARQSEQQQNDARLASMRTSVPSSFRVVSLKPADDDIKAY